MGKEGKDGAAIFKSVAILLKAVFFNFFFATCLRVHYDNSDFSVLFFVRHLNTGSCVDIKRNVP